MGQEMLDIAIDLYDRHLPLFQGIVKPKRDIPMNFLEVGMVPPRRHGIDRHKRMLIDEEFDVAEVSLASYLVARSQGRTNLVALPIFPRRLFSQNHIFVREDSNFSVPSDLIGKKVAIWAFQVTMSVLAKGDFQRDYDTDWRSIHWMTEQPEEVNADYGSVRIDRLDSGFDPQAALRDGQIDAYINPHPPEGVMLPGSGIRRLFRDPGETTQSYFRKHGYFPVMHVIAVKPEAISRYPDLPAELMDMFDRANQVARDYYIDPGFSTIMNARNQIEHEIACYDSVWWKNGVEANRKNLNDFIGYCVDQKLMDRGIQLDELFEVPRDL